MRELLAESFRELAENKTIGRITTREIADNCGYSSATFYRYFQDKYDLIAWDYMQGIKELMKEARDKSLSCGEIFLAIAAFYNSQRSYFCNLLTNTSGHDSFLITMTNVNYDNCVHLLEKSIGRNLDDQEKLCLRSYIDGTVLLSTEWILGRVHASIEEMSSAYAESVPSRLQVTFVPPE